MRDRLDYIYYRLYRFQISVGNGSIAIMFSFLFLSFLVMINFFAFTYILYALFGIKILLLNGGTFGFIVVGMIPVINYFLFIYGKRYQEIIKRYKKEKPEAVKKGNIAVVIYMVFSFVMIGMGFYLMIMRNRGLL
ncbi:hypothetical protein SAMN05421820_103672 [Pedobacter steynii]|uniref:Uncharacterized protein n=1 Tax=Pedobacter steynii TaxID=430522 RepID=A0A1G9SQ34_9SPHI|nr:hypothetical protein [Pedobacter steynii]NQX37353.1 hypothetical protein [Pedobacter steynii]SDM37568.1 hypothetical protein SAMN05421820_103672 [Pedobacter steynii]